MKKNKKIKRILPILIVLIIIPIVLLACSTDKTKELNIIYTTDSHGHLADTEESIGIDTIAAIKEETPHSILVDAGDYLAGDPLANLTEGRDIIELMKLARYDAAAVGNHEFSYGIDVLSQRMQEALGDPNSLHLLAANVKNKGGEDLVAPFITMDVNGIKIGLFGISTMETLASVPTEIAQQLTITDSIEAAKQVVADLENEDCDIIIALSHLGTDNGTHIKSTDLAKQVEGIDVIVDGHSHVILEQIGTEGMPTLVSTGEYSQNVGVLTLIYNKRTNEIQHIENKLINKQQASQYDAIDAVSKKLNSVLAEQEEVLGKVIGHLDVKLIGDKPIIRTQETNFGNLYTDALAEATGADVALINAGNIRADLEAGDLTIRNFMTALPYNELVLTKTLMGSQLIEILEHGLSGLPDAEGQFLQISGLTITVDADKPAGERLTSVMTSAGEEIDLEKEYIIATTEYIAEGGDDFPHFADSPIIHYFEKQNDVILHYINTAEIDRYQSDEPARIVFAQ